MTGQRFVIHLIIFVSIFGLVSCSLVKPELFLPGIDEPITFGDIHIKVVDARIQSSYATHYIMHYPEKPNTFYAITASIEGFDNPQSGLDWGQDNLELISEDEPLKLVHATWTLTGENIQYLSGQDFEYLYLFYYQVPLGSDYDRYNLQLPSGESIEVRAILDVPEVPLQGQGNGVADGESLEIGTPPETDGQLDTIGGGSKNTASAFHTTVSGGHLNAASVAYAAVGGGRENTASNLYTTVGGGYANQASGRDATVAGGSRNTASNYHAAVGGGIRNQASASDTTIPGGSYNQASDLYATVGGGTQNVAGGTGAVVSGGAGNTASHDQSTVAGGLGNLAAGNYAVVAGGQGNTASGVYSTVPGGSSNQALADFSLAAGHRSMVDTHHSGVFLFADSQDADFHSSASNEFGVRASGGVRFVTAIDDAGQPLSGVILTPGSGSWANLSDQAMKENFRPVDKLQILELVASLPIAEWNYTTQNLSVRHIGPVAQDFYAAFGAGESDRYISTIDADGVALAAIQGLVESLKAKEDRIQTLETRLASVETRTRITHIILIVIGVWFVLQKYPSFLERVHPNKSRIRNPRSH